MADVEEIRATVGAIIERYSGRRVAGRQDDFIAGDFRITGGDAIDMVEEIELRYGIDLRPFFEARTTLRKSWLRSWPVAEDATAREFIQAVIDCVTVSHGGEGLRGEDLAPK